MSPEAGAIVASLASPTKTVVTQRWPAATNQLADKISKGSETVWRLARLIMMAVGILSTTPSYAQKESQVIEVLAPHIRLMPNWPATMSYFMLSSTPPGLPKELRTSKTFTLNKDDTELLRHGGISTVVETVEREQILSSFLKQLLDHGLQPAGKGDAWYSYRFRK